MAWFGAGAPSILSVRSVVSVTHIRHPPDNKPLRSCISLHARSTSPKNPHPCNLLQLATIVRLDGANIPAPASDRSQLQYTIGIRRH